MREKQPAVINIGRACENRCAFCRKGAPAGPAAFEEIKNALVAARKAGAEKLVIDGLEPTSAPELPEVAALASRMGFRTIRLETNGIRLADSAFAAGLKKSGINEISIFFPAPDEKTYGRVTGNAAGFSSCVDAVRNVSRMRGVNVSVRIPVCAVNCSCLKETMRAACDTGARVVVLDAGDTSAMWEKGSEQEFLASMEDAAKYGMKIGLAVSLRGRETHHAGGFKDGRLEKAEDEFCLLTYYRPGRAARREIFSADFRLTYRCNQRCVFCAADIFIDEPRPAAVRAKLKELLKRDIKRVCFEGGEPALCAELPEYLSLAKAAGVREIALMTNGVLSADSGFAREVAGAGANRIFVSLHAHEAALSDSITRAPGTFDLTVRGIKNLLEQDVSLYLIFVMTAMNFRTMPDYVKFVCKKFGRVPVLLSMAAPYLSPALDAELIPRYAELAPAMKKAAAVAARRGLPISAMAEQHRPPECAAGSAVSLFRNMFAPIRNAAAAEGFVKPDQCGGCVKSGECPGVRDYYARAHGFSEIVPF